MTRNNFVFFLGAPSDPFVTVGFHVCCIAFVLLWTIYGVPASGWSHAILESSIIGASYGKRHMSATHDLNIMRSLGVP